MSKTIQERSTWPITCKICEGQICESVRVCEGQAYTL